MPSKRLSKPVQTAEPFATGFHKAVERLASIVGATAGSEEGTNVTAFRIKHADVLNRVTQGSMEVLTRNGEKFLILSGAQLVELMDKTETKSKKTMRELHPDLPFLPDSEDRPRYEPLAGSVDHLRSN